MTIPFINRTKKKVEDKPHPFACPVCGEIMRCTYLDKQGRTIWERHLKCDSGHYSYNFCYGEFKISVGDHMTFNVYWDEEYAALKLMAKKVKTAIKALRIAEKYSEYKNGEKARIECIPPRLLGNGEPLESEHYAG